MEGLGFGGFPKSKNRKNIQVPNNAIPKTKRQSSLIDIPEIPQNKELSSLIDIQKIKKHPTPKFLNRQNPKKQSPIIQKSKL